jgi:hypothetical protein
MRTVKERKPEYFRGGKPIYNPGFVDYYQKPWFDSYCGNVKYYGRFAKEGRPGEVSLEFGPLVELINKSEISTPR